jgi:hypothetical protein
MGASNGFAKGSFKLRKKPVQLKEVDTTARALTESMKIPKHFARGKIDLVNFAY